MLKVLIVEDEVLVRTGLRTLVDWETNGFVLCGEAVDGQEALELMEREPADIVITDIRMPVMDGLELIRRIRQQGWPCETIVLSSYDDFDYVRQALVLGARDYIHKPTMTPEDIVAALKRVEREMGHAEDASQGPSSRRRCLNRCLNAWLQGSREPAGAAKTMEHICCVIGVLRMLPPQDVLRQDVLFLELDTAVRQHWDSEMGKGKHMISACAHMGDRWVFAREEPFSQTEAEKLQELAQRVCPGTALWAATPYPGVFSSLEEVLGVLNGRVDEAYALEQELASLGSHVRQAVLIIRGQYAENITLERVAATIHVNAAYLSRVFQKEAHRTFGEYLTDIRLKESQRLLRDTTLTVGQVGERVGYGND